MNYREAGQGGGSAVPSLSLSCSFLFNTNYSSVKRVSNNIGLCVRHATLNVESQVRISLRAQLLVSLCSGMEFEERRQPNDFSTM